VILFNKSNSYFTIILLFLTLIFLNSINVLISQGQTNLVPDKSSIIKTTDCISNMITGVFMHINSDCSDNLLDIKNNNSSNSNLTNSNDSLSNGIENNINKTFTSSVINNRDLKKDDYSLSLENPSSFTQSVKLNQDLPLVNSSSLQSIGDKIKSDNSLDDNNKLKNLLDKNRHGKEIFECFNRAVISISSLPDSAIIKCAKDYDSFN
jgi:hypothetical protein